MTRTRARSNLVAWMAVDKKTRSITAIAKALKISQPSVGGWIRGTARPEPHLRDALEILTSRAVAAKDWTLASENALVASITPLGG